MICITSFFWSNTIWFILLGASTVVEIIIVIRKAENIKYLIALFLIVSGMTFTFEVIIFGFLRAYDYYPMIIPQSSIDDGLVGNLFSQFSVTATAFLITVLNLKYYWYIIFSVTYGVIEESFIKLGIYSHHWYKTWMTMVGVVLLFGVVKGIYRNRLIFKGNLYYISMFFGLYTLHMPTAWWIPILSGMITVNLKILPNAFNSYALMSILNFSILSIICMYVYFSKIKRYWKLAVTLALYIILYFTYRSSLIYVKEGFFLIFASIDIWGMFLCVFTLDKLMKK